MIYVPIYKVMLVRDGSQKAQTRTIASPQDVFHFVRETLENADREMFLVLLMDQRNRVTGVHTVSIGSLSASIVAPRETFKSAILGNAAALICVHNHPSGDPAPSPEDLAITSRLRQTGDLLGIGVLDHVIVGHDRFHSMKEHNQL